MLWSKLRLVTTTALLTIILSTFFFHKPHPLASLSIVELVKVYGYPIEVHYVTTEDGYILALHRIPHSINKSYTNKSVPILITPGIFNSAIEMVCLGPGKALGLILADEGYDVWISNTRGSQWARNHTVLNPDKDPQYWKFTLHEIGVYDTTALINYIVNYTKIEKIHSLGYSQGATTVLIGVAERPQLAQNIRLISAVMPIIHGDNFKSTIVRILTNNVETVQAIFRYFNIDEVFSADRFESKILNFACNGNPMLINVCLLYLYVMQGPIDGFDIERLPVCVANMPSGAGVLQGLHLLQTHRSGIFQNFDWGKERNLMVYGKDTPNLYNLSSIKTPIAFYYAADDWVTGKLSMKTISTFSNVVKTYEIKRKEFSHLEFFMGRDLKSLVFDAIVNELKKL